jgi:hypothetical protein
VRGVCRYSELLFVFGNDSMLANQTGHPASTASVATFVQLCMNSGTSIRFSILTVNSFDLHQQSPIPLASWAFGTFQPGIEPTTTHFQSSTHQTNWKCSPVSPYEITFHYAVPPRRYSLLYLRCHAPCEDVCSPVSTGATHHLQGSNGF